MVRERRRSIIGGQCQALRCCVQARLLEHNVRFGDPECQCLMMRLQSDLLEVLLAAANGQLSGTQLQWSPDTALTVSMTSFMKIVDTANCKVSCPF